MGEKRSRVLKKISTSLSLFYIYVYKRGITKEKWRSGHPLISNVSLVSHHDGSWTKLCRSALTLTVLLSCFDQYKSFHSIVMKTSLFLSFIFLVAFLVLL